MRDYGKALANLKKLSSIAESMEEATEPSEKIGFVWHVVNIGDKELYRELIPDSDAYKGIDEGEVTEEDINAEVEPTGDYIDPIPYVDGMEVETGKFYYADNDMEYRWEAIKDGVPSGFDDKEYFDIIDFYYNPNISPKEEHDFRAAELKRLIDEIESDEEKYKGQSILNIVENMKHDCIDKVITDFCILWYASKDDVMYAATHYRNGEIPNESAIKATIDFDDTKVTLSDNISKYNLENQPQRLNFA